MELPKVPDCIPRARFKDLLKACGIPLEGLRYLECTPSSVNAEFYALDADGIPIPDKDSRAFLVHRIAIPIRDEEARDA
ncbi:MAG TPA: hypothetical protein VFH56_05740 [Acidimicrobiales bacterium]|nr:hypothetical protein [Acidimicrobiales bacterium]